jgi:glutamine amidotransferase
MKVALIDYGSGNLRSAEKALTRAARDHAPGAEIVVTTDPEAVARADRIVLPGVGAFADCRRGLDAIPGMVEALREAVEMRGRPFFGICVGMQLMASCGREREVVEGLGWIPGEVVRLTPDNPALKVPHIGWNTLDARPHPILADIPTGPEGLHAYFVHSYHLQPENEAHRIASFDYGGTATAIVGRDNVVGSQFHPEKSQVLGLRLLGNFLTWTP